MLISTSLFELSFYGNTLQDYLIAGSIFILVFFLIKFILYLFSLLAKFASSKNYNYLTVLLSFMINIPSFFYLILSLYLSLQYLSLPVFIHKSFDGLLLVLGIFQLMLVMIKSSEFVLKKTLIEKSSKTTDTTKFNLIFLIIKILIFVVGTLLFMTNMGIEVTPLVASLGIVSLAVAFAFQKILADIFSSISIFLDEPFKLGDFVSIGGDTGTVKKIGIKTSRFETVQGYELIIPNADIVGSKIINYGKIKRRKVSFKLTISKDTITEKVKSINGLIGGIISNFSDIVELDSINLIEICGGGFVFEITYFINDGDYGIYKTFQSGIYIEIISVLEKNLINLG